MENFLSDILKTTQLKSAVYFKYGFCSSWGMDIPKGNFSQFHLITKGNCLLFFDNKKTLLDKGDIVIVPNGVPHQIKDQHNTICQPGQEIVMDILEGKQPFKGETLRTELICGHFELDHQVNHPIFEQLPELIIIQSGEYGRFELIYSIFELIIEEMTYQKAGYETVSLKLAEILYISIIRHYYLNQSPKKINFFKDELVHKSLNLIHQKLSNSWTLDQLARQVGVSRTLFIERFKNAVGDTPMKYIAKWRMTKAKDLLKNTDLPVIEIGEKIGYQSETSFNRAFKNQFAISPGKFRVKEGL